MTNPYLKNRKFISLERREQAQTKQSFKNQCDIKHIINQYNRTGLLTHTNDKQPQSVDHTQFPDYQDAKNFVTNITQQYDQLNPKTKKQYPDLESYTEHLTTQFQASQEAEATTPLTTPSTENEKEKTNS
jgi:hypothetical protein